MRTNNPVRALLARLSAHAILVAALVAPAACGGSATNSSPSAVKTATEKAPSAWGYVLKASGKDTIPVAQARVWTDPPGGAVMTDSSGYWSIEEGLSPGEYRVLAEFEGVSGRTQLLTAKMAETLERVVVVIGSSAATAWPPAAAIKEKVSKTGKAIKGEVRCCS